MNCSFLTHTNAIRLSNRYILCRHRGVLAFCGTIISMKFHKCDRFHPNDMCNFVKVDDSCKELYRVVYLPSGPQSTQLFPSPSSGSVNHQGRTSVHSNQPAPPKELPESTGMTTIMLRNIPNKYTQKMLLDVINQNFSGLYDFFYLPIDFRNKCNVGYAFINFIHSHYGG